MQTEDFALINDQGLVLRVYVQPGSSRFEVVGVMRQEQGGKIIERLKVKVRARAQEGAANQALIEFLAELCACPKSSITLTAGHTNKAKSLFIAGAGQSCKVLLKSLLTND